MSSTPSTIRLYRLCWARQRALV
ncbi:hypothetical protein A2U01_0102291, partial [Trifolium medium]|nr:hypothetical protein [Trifolium medium]